MLRIRLARWNSVGAVAGLANEDHDSVDVVLHKSKQNPKAICLEAAKRLRKLADAFERLSEMDNPFKEATQRAAAAGDQRHGGGPVSH